MNRLLPLRIALAAVGAALSCAACRDLLPPTPAGPTQHPNAARAAVECSVSRVDRTLRCASPTPVAGGPPANQK
jgi:hypothetical protein